MNKLKCGVKSSQLWQIISPWMLNQKFPNFVHSSLNSPQTQKTQTFETKYLTNEEKRKKNLLVVFTQVKSGLKNLLPKDFLAVQNSSIGDLWHLRHWLQFWKLRTWIHDNLCDLTIKSDTGQHSQLLRCLFVWYFCSAARQYFCLIIERKQRKTLADRPAHKTEWKFLNNEQNKLSGLHLGFEGC